MSQVPPGPPPPQAPPSYSQAVSEGAPFQPPPDAATYKKTPPQQPGGPYPGQPGEPYPGQPGAPYPGQPGAPYPGQPGAPCTGQQYGPGPGIPYQPQMYGQYGTPPVGQPYVAPAAVMIAPLVTVVGSTSTHMVCAHCHAEIDTSVRSSPSSNAWIAGLLIALFGCWMGCCLIPCCMDECMNKEHYCPNCNAFLGSHRR